MKEVYCELCERFYRLPEQGNESIICKTCGRFYDKQLQKWTGGRGYGIKQEKASNVFDLSQDFEDYKRGEGSYEKR